MLHALVRNCSNFGPLGIGGPSRVATSLICTIFDGAQATPLLHVFSRNPQVRFFCVPTFSCLLVFSCSQPLSFYAFALGLGVVDLSDVGSPHAQRLLLYSSRRGIPQSPVFREALYLAVLSWKRFSGACLQKCCPRGSGLKSPSLRHSPKLFAPSKWRI